MRFRLWWREVGSPSDEAVGEDLNLRGDDALELGEEVIRRFNATLRPGERPRELVRVEPGVGEATLRHAWRKTNLVSIANARGHGIHDTYVCEDCGATGKRHGLDLCIQLDPRFRDRTECPGPPPRPRTTRRIPLPRGDER